MSSIQGLQVHKTYSNGTDTGHLDCFLTHSLQGAVLRDAGQVLSLTQFYLAGTKQHAFLREHHKYHERHVLGSIGTVREYLGTERVLTIADAEGNNISEYQLAGYFLSSAQKQLDSAIAERDQARAELAALRQKMQDVLFPDGLPNNCDHDDWEG
jgi:hypothetical protein